MENGNNKLKFTIIWSTCVFVLLLLVGLGITSNKGTLAAAGDVGSCPTSAPYEIKNGKCCPNSNDTINGSRCIPNGVTIVNGTDCKYSGYSYSYTEYVNNGNKIPNKCTNGTPSCTTATSISVGNCSCLKPLSSCGTAVQGLVTEKLYTVTLNSNGADNVGATSTNCNATSSTSCDAPLPTPTRDGYVFKGWGTSSSCVSGATGSYKLDASNTGKTTLYACWVADNITYACYKSGGLHHWVTSDSVIGQTGQKISSISNSDDCKAADSCQSGKFTEDGKCISDSPKVIVKFYNGSSLYDTKDCSIEEGKVNCPITLPSGLTKSGYTFGGWGASGCTTGSNGEVNVSKDSTYYACWSKVDVTPTTPGSTPTPTNPGGNTTPTTPGSTPTPSASSSSSKPASSSAVIEQGSSSSTNVGENPPTGEIAIFVVWVIAAAAIVYSIWYFKQVRES